jgi:SAM-dependent methyltransferase
LEKQAQIDRRNAAFWDELCGSWLAANLGITEPSSENLARFDAAYMDLYPYLDGYLPRPASKAERLLEIGLGYGTVSQILAGRGFDYHGVDISHGPVEMVRYRLSELGIPDAEERVQANSVLELDHPDASFDQVVSIGCLHHTGDLPRAVEQVRRVLRPGGRALVMVYNRHSYRRAAVALRRTLGRGPDDQEVRRSYDSNLEGEAAPATEYVSKAQAKRLFSGFSEVQVSRENAEFVEWRRLHIPRGRLLGWPARLAGLDLYISAIR